MVIGRFRLLIFCLCLQCVVVKAQVINAGVSGNTTSDLLQRLDKDVLQQSPDLVIVMIGTNDMLNSKKMNSYKTYQNNLDDITDKITQSGAKVLLMAPPTADSVYLFKRHDRNAFKDLPNAKLDTIRGIIKRISIDKKLEFLDIYQTFQSMNLPQHNEDLFIRNVKNSGKADGVHPTSLGYRFIGELVYFYLKENELLDKAKKIICFGDSITYGSGTKDPKKESYPSIVSELIENDFKK